jgi:hypothetical protein
MGRNRHKTAKPPVGFSNSGAALLIERSLRKPLLCPQRMRRAVWNKAHFPAVIRSIADGDLTMGPGFYVIAIMGCTDSSAACTAVATMPTRYESRDACQSATAGALEANGDFDFPTLLAQCRPAKAPAADRAPRNLPEGARRG